MMATLSDASGQFVATCFDDAVAEQVEAAAQAGACALLTSSSTAAPGEETPRVTIRSLQPFEGLAKRTPPALEIEVDDAAALRRARRDGRRRARRHRRSSA